MSFGRIRARELNIAELEEFVPAAARRMHARNVGATGPVGSARAPDRPNPNQLNPDERQS
jgi:hypothetical protein